MKYENINAKIMDILREHGELSTPEVAEKVGVGNGVVRQRLKQMAFDGKVTGRRVGKRLLMWSLKKEGELKER